MNKKLNGHATKRSTYWAILNHSSFDNIKVPWIPPLLFDGKVILDFLNKAEFPTTI